MSKEHSYTLCIACDITSTEIATENGHFPVLFLIMQLLVAIRSHAMIKGSLES